jgi:hypothetical protein
MKMVFGLLQTEKSYILIPTGKDGLMPMYQSSVDGEWQVPQKLPLSY